MVIIGIVFDGIDVGGIGNDRLLSRQCILTNKNRYRWVALVKRGKAGERELSCRDSL